MAEHNDHIFMRRCLELASRSEGMTYPNPFVGSVIVYDDVIIGEGYHIKAGSPHAEVNAIESVRKKSRLGKSTLYVNLEPCSFFGKTPPCADFIIENAIPRVVIGTVDTNEKVSGKGIARLRNAGCEVITGVLEKECRWINRRFFTFHERHRPYIILKWAESADGFIDRIRSREYIKPEWISGKPEKVLVHKWRAAEQSILVGAGTIRTDDPRLNVREWIGEDPVKLILSGSGNFGHNFAAAESGRVVVFTHNKDAIIPGTFIVQLNKSTPSCFQIAEYLRRSGIQSILIEGGTKVLNHFIDNNFWDEARVFRGGRNFGEGIKAPAIKGIEISGKNFSGSSLKIYRNVDI